MPDLFPGGHGQCHVQRFVDGTDGTSQPGRVSPGHHCPPGAGPRPETSP
ncbi:hypothetical protein Ae406Ps2_6472c [Pseudonocardia sp. Ae406_Ps2]|nr:hypothetical protein Ae406Ps2_6472c [Pseudonocardia sp. Ae406_Ps2]